MNYNIPNSSHFSPRNDWVFLSHLFRNMFCCFSNDFKCMIYGKNCFFIGNKLVKIHSFNKTFTTFNRLKDILQIISYITLNHICTTFSRIPYLVIDFKVLFITRSISMPIISDSSCLSSMDSKMSGSLEDPTGIMRSLSSFYSP